MTTANASVPVVPAIVMPAKARPVIWADVQAPQRKPNRTAWLLTCVDLTSLLVAFFVLMFSMQTMEKAKWETISGSFQSQFSREVIVPVPAGQGDNAVVRVTGVKSGLAYLDALLHQRLAGVPVWADLQAERGPDHGRGDMVYRVPEAVVQAEKTAQDEAWTTLGAAMRGWKNPVGVRVTAPVADLRNALLEATRLSALLAEGGAPTAFADVKVGDTPRLDIVVRAE